MTGIYMIRNKCNDNKYIGQAQDIHVRILSHKAELNGNYHHNKHLQNAWNKYGPDNFEFIIIEECPLDKLNEREMFWIDYYGDGKLNKLYNVTAGGEGLKNITLEVRKKLSDAKKGRKLSDETRYKMSLAKKGKKRRKWTEEEKKAFSAKVMGRKTSIKQKESARDLMKKRWETQEWRDKMSLVSKNGGKGGFKPGHIQSDSVRKKIGDSQRGKIWVHNENHRLKIFPTELDDYIKKGYSLGMK